MITLLVCGIIFIVVNFVKKSKNTVEKVKNVTEKQDACKFMGLPIDLIKIFMKGLERT